MLLLYAIEPRRSRLARSPSVAIVRKQRSNKLEGGNFLPDALDRRFFLS